MPRKNSNAHFRDPNFRCAVDSYSPRRPAIPCIAESAIPTNSSSGSPIFSHSRIVSRFTEAAKALSFILRDLQAKKAFDPASAVELPYSKTSLFHIGMRDYRPKALSALVKFDHVRMQEEGRYYLRDGHKLPH